MAGLILCADDYALSPGTSAVIRDLLVTGEINATTCLVETMAWPETAPLLRQLTEQRAGLAVGLHLNLTERFAFACADAVRPVSWWLTVAQVADEDAIAMWVHSAFDAQWRAFVEHFGRAPDFIDGHQHVHLYAPARRALFRLVRATGFSGWLRQCRTSSRRPMSQRVVYDPLSARFAREARAHGLCVNPGFGGLRWFRRGERLEEIWRADLAALRGAGGLMIAHPGAADAPADGIAECRLDEATLFADGHVRALTAQLGLDLASNARTWR